jgi:hypothetical protein
MVNENFAGYTHFKYFVAIAYPIVAGFVAIALHRTHVQQLNDHNGSKPCSLLSSFFFVSSLFQDLRTHSICRVRSTHLTLQIV